MPIITTSVIIHLLHITIIGGLFLYVGIVRNSIPSFLFNILLGLSAIIFVYHIYKTYLKFSQQKNPWVNLIHIFAVSPLLAYIGYYRELTPRYIYEILLMFGFASIGYHGFYLVEDISTM
jgi:hypothetical protein